MNNVDSVILMYREKSEQILEALKSDDFQSFYELTDQREELIEKLKKMNLNEVSSEVKQELKLQSIEDEIRILIKNKLHEYKNEMAIIVKNREAHNAYNDHLKTNIHFNTQV